MLALFLSYTGHRNPKGQEWHLQPSGEKFTDGQVEELGET